MALKVGKVAMKAVSKKVDKKVDNKVGKVTAAPKKSACPCCSFEWRGNAPLKMFRRLIVNGKGVEAPDWPEPKMLATKRVCLTTKGAAHIWCESNQLKLSLGDENKILTTFADSLDVGATNLNGQVHWAQYFRTALPWRPTPCVASHLRPALDAAVPTMVATFGCSGRLLEFRFHPRGWHYSCGRPVVPRSRLGGTRLEPLEQLPR